MLASQGNKTFAFLGAACDKIRSDFPIRILLCVVSLYMICINPISEEKFSSYKDCMGPHFIQSSG